MSDSPEKKQQVVIVGSVGQNADSIRSLTRELEERGFAVYGEEEARKKFGKDIMIVDEHSDLRHLMHKEILSHIAPKEIRPEKPEEPWRIKKGPFKGDFRRYR